jgi:hypothetical protein
MKTLVGVFLAGSILIIIGSGCGESSTSAEGTTTNESSSSTPKDRVDEEVGDEVHAGGYAGDLEVKDVSFEGTEAQVTVKTPEGGLQGASCGDLDDGAQAVFETIYNDAGWKGGAVTVFQGGLVDKATGEELPEANTGIYTMHSGQAKQINWSDETALLNIDWSIYRDFCHPALNR